MDIYQTKMKSVQYTPKHGKHSQVGYPHASFNFRFYHVVLIC